MRTKDGWTMTLSRISWVVLALSLAACGDGQLEDVTLASDGLATASDALVTRAQVPGPWGWRAATKLDGSLTDELSDDGSFYVYGYSPTGTTLCVSSVAGGQQHFSIFRRTGSSWQRELKVVDESDSQPGHHLLRRVTHCVVDDNRVIVSYWVSESIGGNPLANRSQLRTYERVNDAWVSYDANAGPERRYFRMIVADGDTLVAQGFSDEGEHYFPVWVYRREGKRWRFEQELVQPVGGADRSSYGLSLDVSAGRIAVSASGGFQYLDGEAYPAPGRVYIFQRGSTGFRLQTTLEGATRGEPGDDDWAAASLGGELGLSQGHLVVTGEQFAADGQLGPAVFDYALLAGGWTTTGSLPGHIRKLDVHKSRFVLTLEGSARIYTQNFVRGPQLEASFALNGPYGDFAGLGDDWAFINQPQLKFSLPDDEDYEYTGRVQTYAFRRPPTPPTPPLELER
jgi:hypothetical protein